MPKLERTKLVKYSMTPSSRAKLESLCEADGLPASTMIRLLITQEYRRRLAKQKRDEKC